MAIREHSSRGRPLAARPAGPTPFPTAKRMVAARGWLVWLLLLAILAGCTGRGPAPGQASLPQAAPESVPEFTGYTGKMSYFQGDAVDFHVSSPLAANSYKLFVFRQGANRSLVHIQPSDQPATVNADLTQAEFGYEWPATATIPGTVTAGWPSGYYLARIERASVTTASSDVWGEYIPFVIKPAVPSSPILVAVDSNTWQAYHDRFGRSYYTTPRTFKVSFHRPARKFSSTVAWIEGQTDQTVTTWAGQYLRWLDANGYAVDVVTNQDIRDDAILNTDNYRLFLSVGHDEYWDHPMRDTLQAFVDGGGNAIFFSSNTMYYQVRFEDDGDTMTSYKIPGYASVHDPMWGVNNSLVTTHWALPPVNNPEASLAGLTYHQGGVGIGGYRVYRTGDWVFAGTGLANGQVIGNYPTLGAAGDDILAQEVDATEYGWNAGLPVVVNAAQTGTPAAFTILGIENEAASDPAVMGYYTNAAGATVFHTGTWDWWKGLFLNDPSIVRITRNLLDQLSQGPLDPAPISRPAIVTQTFREGVDGYAGTTDAYLDLDQPAANFGAAQTLNLHHNIGGDRKAALIRFDVSGLPEGAVIESAQLRLYGTSLAGGGELKVSKLLPAAAWDEAAATWNQAAGSVPWPGGWATTGASLENEFVRVTGRAISFELGPQVQAWLADPASNWGIALRGYTTYDGNWGWTQLSFASSEHPDPGLRPQLVVRYRPCVLRGDVTGDGQVDVQDLIAVAEHWNTEEGQSGYDPDYNLDGDDNIDVADIEIVAGQWGSACR